MSYKPDPEVGLAMQSGLIDILQKQVEELTQQRDELLAALERIATSRVVDIAVTAIAKVKEQK